MTSIRPATTWHNGKNVDKSEIGYLRLGEKGAIDHRLNSIHNRENEVLQQLTRWGLDNHFDAVIWRDRDTDAHILRGKTLDVAGNEVITHLQGDAAAAAAKYVRGVPIQVWTAILARIAVQPIAVQAGWMPGCGNATITTADDLRFKDWQGCRATIGRLDTILEDLRKVDFSLITGLLTAGAFLGFSVSAPSPDVCGAVFIAIMALVAALFSVDTYYQILLSGGEDATADQDHQVLEHQRHEQQGQLHYLVSVFDPAGYGWGHGTLATGELRVVLQKLELNGKEGLVARVAQLRRPLQTGWPRR